MHCPALTLTKLIFFPGRDDHSYCARKKLGMGGLTMLTNLLDIYGLRLGLHANQRANDLVTTSSRMPAWCFDRFGLCKKNKLNNDSWLHKSQIVFDNNYQYL